MKCKVMKNLKTYWRKKPTATLCSTNMSNMKLYRTCNGHPCGHVYGFVEFSICQWSVCWVSVGIAKSMQHMVIWELAPKGCTKARNVRDQYYQATCNAKELQYNLPSSDRSRGIPPGINRHKLKTYQVR